MTDTTPNKSDFCSTGVSGLDHVLGGMGLPKGCLYLLEGRPGCGKTTVAIQFLLEGARNGERTLYIGLSETRRELDRVAKSHGWDLTNIEILDLPAANLQQAPGHQGTLFQPAEVELNKTTEVFIEKIKASRPDRIVFDSVSEMRLLAGTSIRYRRQILALKQFFAALDTTVLFLDDCTTDLAEFQVKSIVHGALSLEVREPDFGVELRRLKVLKIRGQKYRGGYHDYIIATGGVVLFPRLVAAEYATDFHKETISSGIANLDLLLGGGLDRGTCSLFLGPAGTGKSTIAMQYAHAAAKRGEKVAFYIFEENLGSLVARARQIGLDISGFIADGTIITKKIDPAEKSPGQFTDEIRKLTEENGIRMVVIDSLNGYVHSMPHESYLTMQLHELLAYLAHRKVATIIVLTQQGLLGIMSTPVDLTYIADTVLITRYFEDHGGVKKAVSVIKKRTGFHENTIREFTIRDRVGLTVGRPLTEFQGILTGVPSIGPSRMLPQEGPVSDGASSDLL